LVHTFAIAGDQTSQRAEPLPRITSLSLTNVLACAGEPIILLPGLVRLAVFVFAAVTPVTGAPFIPESDSQVLEHLPCTANDPAMRELRTLRDGLKNEPDNLPLALGLARRYLELGRVTGDPRYAGYAQAALTPWWDLKQPPEEILVLRATLRQRVHQFDAALADLAAVLDANPRNLQARLTRATVLQVQGAYAAAREECLALRNLTQAVVATACLASVNGLTGKLRESYAQLRAALDKEQNVQKEVRSWVLTSLAEMVARACMAEEARRYFREALALDAADNYLLGAYADFLLDQNHPEEVIALLQDKTRADPLLLRYALALKVLQSKDLPAQVGQLHDRFEASRLRGDRVHIREEARFTLHLLNEPKTALKLAEENWQVQKEPADVRILLESALAAKDPAVLETTRGWLTETGLEDCELERLLTKPLQPN
jgi:tetratricopeptide (TPR) repeat protein